MVRTLLTALVAIGIIWGGAMALAAIMDLEDRLAAEQSRRESAEQLCDALLSDGHFRKTRYDPKTGFSVYTFVPSRTKESHK